MRRFFQFIVLIFAFTTSLAVAPRAVAQGKPRVVATGRSSSLSPPKSSTFTPAKASTVAPGKPGAVQFEQAFTITQKHYFLGRWQILLNKDKIKATNITDGYSIVTMAPTWKVVYFRDNGGAKMYETTMESFMLTGLPLSGGYVIEGHIQQAGQRKSDYKGLKTIEYSFRRAERVGPKPAWTLADMPREAGVTVSQYWVSPIITRDHMVGNFLQKLFMVPATVGYPVAFIDSRTDNTRNAVLDILSCRGLPPAEVQITYPSPSKYKLCKGVREVTLSTAKSESFNEWAETLGKD